jgi:hypothetical protein
VLTEGLIFIAANTLAAVFASRLAARCFPATDNLTRLTAGLLAFVATIQMVLMALGLFGWLRPVPALLTISSLVAGERLLGRKHTPQGRVIAVHDFSISRRPAVAGFSDGLKIRLCGDLDPTVEDSRLADTDRRVGISFGSRGLDPVQGKDDI